MYKLIIVDDEQYIREGLSSIKWCDIGIELKGTFKHGLEAYKYLRENTVDIMLLDIRMPIMDGLELSEKVKAYFPDIKIIVLSGHDEFEYAKKCIQNGIFEYLLKPINREELLETVKKIINLLDEERKFRKEVSTLRRKTNSLIKVFRGNFLEKLLNNKIDNDVFEEGCCYSEMILDYEYYAISIIRLDGKAENSIIYSEEDWDLIIFAINNILDELWEEKELGYYYIDEKKGLIYLLITDQSILNNLDDLKEQLEELKVKIYKIRGLLRTTISISIGNLQNSIENIYLSTLQCQNVLDTFEIEDEVIFYQDEIHGDTVLHDSYMEVSENQDEICLDNENEYSTNYIIEVAKKYIESNYMKAITLEDISKEVYVTRTYLSHLFKQVVGTNFVQYLTNIRINKATELLRNHEYKIYEIGEMVGYENSRYFSEIFKKSTGKTPNQYRNSVGNK